jgi:hypothetical protein
METNRKVTDKEVEKLYWFTRQHFVEHFDVQMELVDHLASSIEDMWEENREITFDDALGKTFKKFGIFGFSDVVEGKVKELDKKYFKKIFRHTVERLKWPKILSSLALAVLIYYVVVLFNYSRYSLVAIYVLGGIIAYLKLYSFQKKWKKKTNGVKLLSIEMSLKAPALLIYVGYMLFINPILSFSKEGFFEANSWGLFITVFVFALFSLVSFDSIYGLEDDIEESYNKYLAIA